MIHMQVISRNSADLKRLVRRAIVDGRIRSFYAARIKGGLCLKHRKHPGRVDVVQTSGPLLCTVSYKHHDQEWQLLDAFIGRLVYHFRSEISAINIQLGPAEE